MKNDNLKVIAKYLDTERLLNNARNINEIEYFFSFSSFKKSADMIYQYLSEVKIEKPEKHHIPADGKSKVWDMVMPLAWDVEKAVLKSTTDNKILADYSENPLCLAMWSAPSPSGGITAYC
ncbi:MAG: hypothetical protein ACYTFY_16970 [Planctomycetota bacterium]